jgi:hypothetical protein
MNELRDRLVKRLSFLKSKQEKANSDPSPVMLELINTIALLDSIMQKNSYKVDLLDTINDDETPGG